MKTPPRRFDVVVIGGGPSGSAAAITAAQAGQRVALVERQRFPRHRPGETLAPGVEPLFRKLDVWDEVAKAGFIRHPGHWVEWEGEPIFTGFGGTKEEPWLGMQAWRPTLDAILLQRARAAGVEVFQPCRALSPIIEDGRVAGVLTHRGEIHARHVIDASGSGEWLARNRRKPAERRSPRLAASYGYVQTDRAAQWFLPRLQAGAGGWTWTAQVRADVVAWTRLSADGSPSAAPPALAGARRLSVGASTADVTWRCSQQAAGPGWFLAGDAALVLDPASSHGVLRALMSGMTAAHLSTQVCRDKTTEESAAAAYTSWVRAWFGHDAERLAALYRRLPSPPPWLGERRRAGPVFRSQRRQH